MSVWLAVLCACGMPDPGESGADTTAAIGDTTTFVETAAVDEDADGWVAADDCNDASARAYPGAPELCDEIDNDCDALVDEDDPDVADAITWYRDADGDAYGDALVSSPGCGAPPAGWSTDATDCDDTRADRHPGAQEQCNERDDDCDGAVDSADDDGPAIGVWYFDADGDGWGGDTEIESCEDLSTSGWSARDGDCDDGTAEVFPGAPESCNGVDDDCDARTDDADDDVVDASPLYLDVDGDGFAPDGATSVMSCEDRAGYASEGGDCDDGDPQAYPGAPELCDRGTDNDCDGRADGQDDDVVDASTWYRDADGDGYGTPTETRQACTDAEGWVTNDDDCDDLDASVGRC